MTDQFNSQNKQQKQEYSTPVETLRDGRVKATIWKRHSEQGVFYTTSFASIYQDNDGNLQDGNSFTDTNTLKLSELSRRTYMRMRELKRDDQEQTQSHKKQRPFSRDR